MILWVGIVMGLACGIAWAIIMYNLKRQRDNASLFPNITIHEITTTCVPEKVGTNTLLAFRVLYLAFSIAIIVIVYVESGKRALIYFTTWNFHIQTVYFALAVIIHVRQMLGARESSSAGWMGEAMHTMCQINVTFVVLVAIITWTVLYPQAEANHKGHRYLTIQSFSQHLINVPFVLIDFYLSRFTIHIPHVAFVFLWVVLYGSFATVYQLFNGRPPYFFVDGDSAMSPPALVGVLLFVGLMFLLARLQSNLKVRMTGEEHLIAMNTNVLVKPLLDADSLEKPSEDATDVV